MNEETKWQKVAVFGIPVVAVSLLALIWPGFITNPLYLGGLILIEIVLAALWHFRTAYFALTMIFFLWAGMDVPLEGAALTARWFVLAVGAIGGAFLWLREHRQPMNALHLIAFLCVPIAAVTAIQSVDPQTSLMKVASLFLVFLYASTGVRVASEGNQSLFVRKILRACEVIAYASALCYGLGFAVWGNPNSLGAVVAVVLLPFLLWGFLATDNRSEKNRLGFALLLCGVLLYTALSRASILAAVVGCVTMCICLRRQRVLLQGAFGIVLLLAFAAVLRPASFEQFSAKLTDELLHKGKDETGVLDSRKKPWDETVSSFKQHPWFGSGFGTSDMVVDGPVAEVSALEGVYTKEGRNREHGNSYLALAEYVGILGLLSFGLLLLLIVRMVIQMCLWMRRTSNIGHPAIPLAIVLLAGLVHAFFEDWLIAVGYHLCVFFWVAAFLLRDLIPQSRRDDAQTVLVPFHSRADAGIFAHSR